MDPFLDRFYDEVDDNLADPHSQKRLTKAQRYRDLFTIQNQIFERLLNATGQESMLARAEADITLVVDQEFYDLPPSFRHFVRFEKRVNGDPDHIRGTLRTLAPYSEQAGIQIISSQRGFRVQPVPATSQEAGAWTMIYLKGPVKLHYATAGTVADLPEDQTIDGANYVVSTPVAGTNRITYADHFTAAMLGETITFESPVNGTDTVEGALATITAANADYIEFAAVTGLATDDTFTIDADWCWVVSGTPATDAGEKVAVADYYNGSLLRIYSGTTGDRQVKEIMDYYLDAGDSAWHFKLRHAWDTLPTGTIKYEICPELAEGYDSLYAMDVAIRNSGRRSHIRRRAGLLDDRHELWKDCRNSIANNTMDRAPSRIIPPRVDEVDPYSMGVYT